MSGYKEYRGLPHLGHEWVLPAATLAGIHASGTPLESKTRIVDALFDDGRSVEMCALILALYTVQWESANPAWSLRERPEIVATLYQLGFEKSHPKAHPVAIPFGWRVREVSESAWMREHFPPVVTPDDGRPGGLRAAR